MFANNFRRIALAQGTLDRAAPASVATVPLKPPAVPAPQPRDRQPAIRAPEPCEAREELV